MLKTTTDYFKSKSNLLLALGIAFIVPIIILVGIFIGREIYPFGDQMYLRSDCYHQYAPFYKELYRKLTEGGSLTYSWEIGMGLNFTSLYAYYLASPINLLLGLIPEAHIIEAMGCLIILKVAASCTTCAYYLSKRFNTTSLAVAAFGLFYGFSSYFAAYSWNIMWLDCMVLLPLIVLGLDRLVRDNKCFLYCVALGLSIFSNYYIAIMLCIYCVIYFIYLIFTEKRKLTSYFVAVRSLNFIIYSVIAGCFAMCLIIPEVYTLGLSSSGEFSFPETLTNYFSIMDMLSRNVMKMYASIFDAHSPNIYFSVCVYLLVPLYCLCSKVPLREKIGKVIIVVLFFFSFNLNIPNYIWHGFHFPNSLPCRESFILIFLLITMCFEAAIHYKEYTNKQLFGSFAGGMGLLMILEKLYVGTKVFDEPKNVYLFNFIYLSMFFVFLYLVVMIAARNPKIRRNFVIYLLFIVSVAEVAINTDETGYSTTSRVNYTTDNAPIENLVAEIDKNDDELFYRIEKLDRRTKNDAAWNGYYGVSTFTSTANASITEVLGRFGFEKSANAYSSTGSTPLTSGMLGIKYYISNSVIEDSKYLSLYLSDEENNKYIYKNNYYLPLGYMADSDTVKKMSIEGNNPFSIQNKFVNAALGIPSELPDGEEAKKLFTQISAVCVGDTVEITVEEASHVYVYVTSYLESVSVSANCEEQPDFIYNQSFTGLKHRHIIDLGYMPAGTIATVSTSDDISSLQLYAYVMDEEYFDDIYKELSDEPLNIKEFEDTYIKGTVNAKKDGLLMTSINYDEGWKVYVDGKQVDLVSIKGAFIGVNVPAGEHTVEFKFFPVGLLPGLIISALAVIAFLGLVFYYMIYPRIMAKKNGTANASTASSNNSIKIEDINIEAITVEEIDDNTINSDEVNTISSDSK